MITKVCKHVVPLRHTTSQMRNTIGNHRNVLEHVKPIRFRSNHKWVPTGRVFMMKDHKWTLEYNYCHPLRYNLQIPKRPKTCIMNHCLSMTAPFINACHSNPSAGVTYANLTKRAKGWMPKGRKSPTTGDQGLH